MSVLSCRDYIEGLVQEKRNSIADTLELCLSYGGLELKYWSFCNIMKVTKLHA